MEKVILIVLGVLVIGGVGYAALSGEWSNKIDAVGKDQVVQDKTSTNEKKTSEQIAQQEPLTTNRGSYESYDAGKIGLGDNEKVVLFFHASWCPSCRALNTDIEKNATTIPDGVTILKTDFDKETELKKKYGVTTQHTLVQVDGDGNLIKKWSGGSKVANLLSQIE